MKYKMLIADMDGTLFAPSELPAPKPSAILIEKVSKLHQVGLYFTVATARYLPWAIDFIKGLNLKTPVILDNGARIYDPKSEKYIWETYIKQKDSQLIIQELLEDKEINLIVIDKENRFENLAANYNKIKMDKIIKILVLGITPQKAKSIYNRYKKFPSVHTTISVSGTDDKSQSIHITNLNATKRIAAQKIFKLLGFSSKEVIAVGDSNNDLPLFMACGFKVAMGNAQEELKSKADYIAPTYQKNGVIHVIDKFLLKNIPKSYGC
jgi:hypothetical protein